MGPPIALYHVKKRGSLVRQNPRSKKGECEGGICFVCHPNKDPSRETYSQLDSTVAQDLSYSGVATVLSIDLWNTTKESKCQFEKDPALGVNFICMQPDETPSTKTPDIAEAARYQEIFIDLVGMLYAVNDAASRHVLDDRFDSFFTPGEKEFKDYLYKFLQHQSKEAKATHAFSYLEKTLLDKMGYRNIYGWANRSASAATRKESRERSRHGNAASLNDNPGHAFVCNASVCDIHFYVLEQFR
jgi:hypothetical protein